MTNAARPCGSCGYDLRGLAANLCPECGKPIIDHAARERAATLIDRFRDGHITNDQLEDGWPSQTADRTIRRCFGDVWYTYSDTREYWLEGRDAPSEQVRGALTRWALFLRSGEVCDDACDPSHTAGVLIVVVLWCIGVLAPLVLAFFRRPFQAITGINAIALVPLSLACFAVIYSMEWLPRIVRRFYRRAAGAPVAPAQLFPFTSEEQYRRCAGDGQTRREQ